MDNRHKIQRTPAQWIDYIAQQELPALTSTAQLLDKFADDDVSSLPRLSKAILHDQALSTCLLKMANSVARVGANPITTVSRATVILGIHSVKNICLTSKIIDSLVRDKALPTKVFKKIKRLMASAFYAGQIAKMMLANYSDETQEEVYLAAMLHGIGETAFWCLGEQLSEELETLASVHHSDYEQACFDLLGMTFDQLTIALAQKWNLGSLLVKSFDHPEQRTKEMQVIYLADQLARLIDNPSDEKAFATTLSEISRITQLPQYKLARKLKTTQENAINLLTSYGAESIADYIKPLPTIADFNALANETELQPINKDRTQLDLIQQLTDLSMNKKNINLLLQVAIKHVTSLLDMEYSSFLLLSSDKKQLSARFTYNQQHQKVGLIRTFELSEHPSVIEQSLTTNEVITFNHFAKSNVNNKTDQQLYHFIDKGRMIIGPVTINKNTIGMICAKRSATSEEITSDDSQRFTYVLQHLSMCLSMVSLRH